MAILALQAPGLDVLPHQITAMAHLSSILQPHGVKVGDSACRFSGKVTNCRDARESSLVTPVVPFGIVEQSVED